jgi:hypothetical protein
MNIWIGLIAKVGVPKRFSSEFRVQSSKSTSGDLGVFDFSEQCKAWHRRHAMAGENPEGI